MKSKKLDKTVNDDYDFHKQIIMIQHMETFFSKIKNYLKYDETITL